MNADESAKTDGATIPPEVADAWATVYLDVAEKIETGEGESGGRRTDEEPEDT